MNAVVDTLPQENVESPARALLQYIAATGDGGLTGNQADFSELHDKIMQLEKLIFSFEHDAARTRPSLPELTPEMMARLTDAYQTWENGLERKFAEELIQGRASLTEYPLHERLESLVKREIALIASFPPKRILFVGSGPLPLSAVHMHLQTGSPVDCVAQDSATLPAAQRVLECCGLSDSVKMLHDANAGPNISEYDLVLVASPAKIRKSILTALRKQSRSGCQILWRTLDGLRRLAPGLLRERELQGFYVKAEQIADGQHMISTRLLEPAGRAAAAVRLEWVRAIDSRCAAGLLRLVNRTLEEETTIGFPGPIDDETGYALMRQLHADVEAGRRHVLIAEIDGVIVGQLIMTPNSSPNHRHIVELTRGTIDRSFRGSGLALRAFEEVVKKCEELEREVICLDVRAGTMAAIWWQHFGFKPFGLLQDYSRVGDKRYQGLYLTQTRMELKESIKAIAGVQQLRDNHPSLTSEITIDL